MVENILIPNSIKNTENILNKNLTFMKSKIIHASNYNITSIVEAEINRLGNNANLNHIDVSKVTNMDSLFSDSVFNGDISNWDVSNVETMRCMFLSSEFTGDISKWNVSKVVNMAYMFKDSIFNNDISKWDVSNVVNMDSMFAFSVFNNDISNWDVSKVENMKHMFYNSEFSYYDITNWDISSIKTMDHIFTESAFKQDITKWNDNNIINIDITESKDAIHIKIIDEKLSTRNTNNFIIDLIIKLRGFKFTFDFKNRIMKSYSEIIIYDTKTPESLKFFIECNLIKYNINISLPKLQ